MQLWPNDPAPEARREGSPGRQPWVNGKNDCEPQRGDTIPFASRDKHVPRLRHSLSLIEPFPALTRWERLTTMTSVGGTIPAAPPFKTCRPSGARCCFTIYPGLTPGATFLTRLRR